jgi:hypothetical protein
MRTEFILCSAIRRKEPKECTKHYHDNDIYGIELGYRHCDIFARFEGEVSTDPNDQGFYTSRGRFVDRHEAFFIAYHANQIPIFLYDDRGNDAKLFSEDLY